MKNDDRIPAFAERLEIEFCTYCGEPFTDGAGPQTRVVPGEWLCLRCAMTVELSRQKERNRR